VSRRILAKIIEGSSMAQQNFAAVFPEGLTPLAQADPEVFSIIKDEEERQWYSFYSAF
jgi:hypothetical protein